MFVGRDVKWTKTVIPTDWVAHECQHPRFPSRTSLYDDMINVIHVTCQLLECCGCSAYIDVIMLSSLHFVHVWTFLTTILRHCSFKKKFKKYTLFLIGNDQPATYLCSLIWYDSEGCYKRKSNFSCLQSWYFSAANHVSVNHFVKSTVGFLIRLLPDCPKLLLRDIQSAITSLLSHSWQARSCHAIISLPCDMTHLMHLFYAN